MLRKLAKLKHDTFVFSIFSFTTRRLCCKTCQSKIAQVAFSTVGRQNGCCQADGTVGEIDKSTNRGKNGSTSGLQLNFLSNLVELNRFVTSILFEKTALSPREDLSDRPEEEILKSLNLKCEENDDSICFGNNTADVVAGNSVDTAGNHFIVESSGLAADNVRTSEVFCEKNLDQNIHWYKKLFGVSGISKCICGEVLSSITNQSRLGGSSEDEKTDIHALLPDVVRFLLPGLPLMCDFDQTRIILYELKFPFLLVQYFRDVWCCLVGKECDAETTVSLPCFQLATRHMQLLNC